MAPKLKFHLIPSGFSEENDQDIQRQTGDELVPVVAKSRLLEDVIDLACVRISRKAPLTPIEFGAGRRTENLAELVADSGYYLPTVSAWPAPPYVDPADDSLVVAGGAAWWLNDSRGLILYDDQAAVIDPANYEITELGIRFADDFAMPPSMTASLYRTQVAAGSRTEWALNGDVLYSGTNRSWNKLILWADDEDPYAATITAAGVIVLSSAKSKLLGTYATTATASRYWIGEQNNWIDGHYNLNPDVFVGEVDYPGDQYVDEAELPQEPGWLPQYRSPSTFQLNTRDGLVTFPEVIDPTADGVAITNLTGTVVKALHGHLSEVDNVDEMPLTYQGLVDGRHQYEQQGPLSTSTRLQSLNRGEGVGSSLQIFGRYEWDDDGSGGTPDVQIEWTIGLSGHTTVGDLISAVSSATSGEVSLAVDGERLIATWSGGGSAHNFSFGGVSAAPLGLDQSVDGNVINGTQANFPELAYPEALGKRLVVRDDPTSPLNVYIDGALAPAITPSTGPDTLTVKLS